MKTPLERTRRIIAILALMFFLAEQIIPTAHAQTLLSTSTLPINKAPSLQVPYTLGEVDVTSHTKNSKGLIFHIQDAHGQFEAQKNIRGILKYFAEEKEVSTFFLEGGQGKLQPELLQFFPNQPNWNKDFLEDLSKNAELSGAELYLAENAGIQAYGIETISTYRKNREAFQRVLREEEKTKAFLAKMEMQIERLTAPYLNSKLKSFLKQNPNDDLFEKLKQLKKYAKTALNLDLEDAFYQWDWPMSVRIFKMQTLQSQMNLSKLKHQRESFLKFLKIRNLSEEKIQLITPLFTNPFSQKKDKAIAYETLIHGLETLLQNLPENFEFESYEQVKLAIQYRIFEKELDPRMLFEELERLRIKIAEMLAQNETEKKIIKLLFNYELLEKAFTLEFTPQDYAKSLKNPESLRPSNIAKSFEALNPENRVRNMAWKKTEEAAFLSELDQLFDHVLEFYKMAKDRDHFMAANMIKQMQSLKENKAVLVTGGFHAKGIKLFLEKQGFSYVRITPRITEISGPEKYRQAMLAGHAKPETSQVANILKSMSLLKQQQHDQSKQYKTHVRLALLLALVRLAQKRNLSRSELRNKANKDLFNQYGIRDFQSSAVEEDEAQSESRTESITLGLKKDWGDPTGLVRQHQAFIGLTADKKHKRHKAAEALADIMPEMWRELQSWVEILATGGKEVWHDYLEEKDRDEFWGLRVLLEWLNIWHVWQGADKDKRNQIRENLEKISNIYEKDLQGVLAPGDERPYSLVIAPEEIKHFDDEVRSFAISEDGKWFASGHYDGSIRLWDALAGEEVEPRILSGPGGGTVAALAFSPNGNSLAGVKMTGTIILWSTEGEEAKVLGQNQFAFLSALAFSRDGKSLASGHDDGSIRLWNTESGTDQVPTLLGQGEGPFYSLAFSKDKKSLLSGQGERGNQNIFLWNLRGGEKQIPKLIAQNRPRPFSLAVSMDGKSLVSGHEGGAIYLWSMEAEVEQTSTLLATHERGVFRGIFSLEFSSDGKSLMGNDSEGNLLKWDLHESLRLPEFDQALSESRTEGITLGLKEDWGDPTGLVRQYQAFIDILEDENHKKHQAAQALAGIMPLMWSELQNWMSFLEQGDIGEWHDYLLDHSQNTYWGLHVLMEWLNIWHVWQGAKKKKREALQKNLEKVSSIYNQDLDGVLEPSDERPYSLVIAPEKIGPFGDQVVSFAVSDDGKWFATGHFDGSVRLWDALAGEEPEPTTLSGPGGGTVSALAFSPDGKSLASVNMSGTIVLWSTEREEGKTLGQNQLPFLTVLAFSRDGKSLASGHEDGAIYLWNTEADEEQTPVLFAQSENPIYSLAFSKDKKSLLTGDKNRNILLWNFKAGEKQTPMRLAQSKSNILALSTAPDGKSFISGHEDGAIRLWSTEAGPEQTSRLLRQHKSGIFYLAVSNDGKSLTSHDGRGNAHRYKSLQLPEFEAQSESRVETKGSLVLKATSFLGGMIPRYYGITLAKQVYDVVFASRIKQQEKQAAIPLAELKAAMRIPLSYYFEVLEIKTGARPFAVLADGERFNPRISNGLYGYGDLVYAVLKETGSSPQAAYERNKKYAQKLGIQVKQRLPENVATKIAVATDKAPLLNSSEQQEISVLLEINEQDIFAKDLSIEDVMEYLVPMKKAMGQTTTSEEIEEIVQKMLLELDGKRVVIGTNFFHALLELYRTHKDQLEALQASA